MRLLWLPLGVFTCGLAAAQQPPALPAGPTGEMLPGVSTLRPEYVPAPAATPRPSAAADGVAARQKLIELIRAQSEAIRVLSGKVDTLDDRLRRIEGKLR